MTNPLPFHAGKRIAFRPLAAVVAVALAGCSLNRMGTEEVSATVDRHLQQGAATGENYARTPAAPPPEEPAATQPTATQPGARLEAPATLREFIVLALQENPEIKASEETARAQANRIPQVTALPDPMLSTKTSPEPVRTAEGDSFFVLGISQKFPVPGKLDRAGRIALEETRMTLERLQQVRLGVIADVKRAYFRLYIIDRTIEITERNQGIVRGLIEAALGQVAAGKRQQDSLRAQVELSNLESNLIELRQQRVSVQAMLNTLLNRPVTTRIAPPPTFGIRRVDATLEDLFARGKEANPDLRRFEHQIERDRHAVELARLAYWPDFTLGMEWMNMEPRDAFEPPVNPQTGMRPAAPQISEDGSDNWAITFGFNIPLWVDKIQAGVREARRRLSATMQQYASARNRVTFGIEDALARVRAQQQLAEIFKTTIIPQARQAYEVTRSGYATGLSDFQFVIDNWQKWLTFTIQYHRALGELERAVADLEEAIGLSITELGTPDSGITEVGAPQ